MRVTSFFVFTLLASSPSLACDYNCQVFNTQQQSQQWAYQAQQQVQQYNQYLDNRHFQVQQQLMQQGRQYQPIGTYGGAYTGAYGSPRY